MYRVETKTFEKISEAKAAAREALIGRAEDAYVLVYEYQETTGDLRPGYWEPVARASYNRYHKPTCK